MYIFNRVVFYDSLYSFDSQKNLCNNTWQQKRHDAYIALQSMQVQRLKET